MSSTARGRASFRAACSISLILGAGPGEKKFRCEALRRQFILREHPRRAGGFHGARVVQLVSVSGSGERDKDGGASGGGDFRDGDGARAADDYVGLGKLVRHIFDEGADLRDEFSTRISNANRIIVTFAGLMHDEKLVFSGGEKIERVNNAAIDGQSAAAASGDEDAQRRLVVADAARRRIRGARGCR